MKEISNKLKSHFLRLYQIAFSDDNFDILELKMLYHFAEERGVSEEQLQQVLLNPLTSDAQIPDTLNQKIEYLNDLAKMIWADGIVTEDERNTLSKYCKRFGFLDENLKQLVDFLLECAKQNLSVEEILLKINE
ncbi:TerB family tellurite resistance protein [Winogradskyella psychrotolerans]|uniref:tellurite resistance TerB family protein n=1 Tax=Winogradskyella psychrotolerans TaxID=1344585 RepID=UPI001C07A0E6|nr:TerB family tellurite resistance protein [Winogradskyella psychrotolerans]MBU2920704.1 TerB family tellurite resistance protein [Winogradskyella psychrotolerans]